MVAGQNIKLARHHRGKIVTVVVEDTHLRILHNDEEIAVRVRKNLKPITRFRVTSAGLSAGEQRQASDDDESSNIS
ncbi:hypothetical protein [Nocardia xishanensis]